MNQVISASDAAFLAAEEAILRDLLAALKDARDQRSLNYHRIGERIRALRDEATKAKTADLPALFDQMNTQRALIEHKPSDELPDARAPFFAHMRLVENGKIKDILLGHYTFLDGPCPVIDWRHAPVSRIYFNYREGDDYEEELPGRVASGEVIARAVVTIVEGELVQVTRAGKTFRKNAVGNWEVGDQAALPTFGGGAESAQRGLSLGTGQSGGIVPEIAALLDAEQFALLDSPEGEPLLILGGAGSGKTTVALHRVATLNYRDPVRYDQSQMTVIVPEPGLVRLSKKLLAGLGLRDVQVLTFDDWVTQQARFFLRNLPRRICDTTPAAVINLKRHAAVRSVFAKFIALRAEEIAGAMAKVLRQSDVAQATIRTRTDLCLLDRLDLAANEYLALFAGERAHWNPTFKKTGDEFFRDQRRKIWDLNSDRMDLFSNIELVQDIVAAAEGDLPRSVIEVLHHHSLDQFGIVATAGAYAGVDADRLETVSGHNLSEDPLHDKAGTIDVEDFAVMIELAVLKTGRIQSPFGRLKSYAHMAIDEAQELSPIELEVIGRCLKKGAALTIAGDAAQQSDPGASFESWERLLTYLGVKVVRANHLTTSYRSTKPIALFAHKVLGPLAPQDLPRTIKDGVPVARSLFPNDGHVVIFLRDAIADLRASEPKASLAIVCRNEKSALGFFEALSDLDVLRYVPDGEFSFLPGVDVTTAQAVKGLEFDYVVIPDASSLHYPDTPHDRRLLHVAATRAIHQLWVIGIGRESQILTDPQYMLPSP